MKVADCFAALTLTDALDEKPNLLPTFSDC